VSKLKEHGLIHKQANLSDEDKATVNKLSESEVNSLISIKAKLPADFVKKHAGVGTAEPDTPEPKPGAHTVGIVF
jgi:hypothetical protein